MEGTRMSHLQKLLQQIEIQSQKSADVASEDSYSVVCSGMAMSDTMSVGSQSSGVECDASATDKPYMSAEELVHLDKLWEQMEAKYRSGYVLPKLDIEPEPFWEGECDGEGSALPMAKKDDKPKASPSSTGKPTKRAKQWVRKPKQANAKPATNHVEMYLDKVQGRERLAELKYRLIRERVNRAKMESALMQEGFHIISMAYFCRTINDDYVPAELGVIKYSLQDGVKEQLHMHINPGKLPFGLTYLAHHHSEKTHALPLPPNALGSADYEEIATILLGFLDTSMQTPLLLFTNAKDVPKVESMLKAILDKRYKEGMLYVCSLTELLHQLLVVPGDDDAADTDARNKVQSLFDIDSFSYTSGISCDYHESQNLLVHCALSECIRWSYVISAACCKPLNIPLIPGKHMPLVKEVKTTRPTDTVDPANGPADHFSDDESNYADSVIINDNVSFVSYATDYTDMLPGEVQSCAGSVYNGSVYNGSVYNGSVYNGSVCNESVYNGSVCNGSVYNGSVYNDEESLQREYGILDAVREHKKEMARKAMEASGVVVAASKPVTTNEIYTLSSYGRILIEGDSIYEHGGEPRKSHIRKKYYK